MSAGVSCSAGQKPVQKPPGRALLASLPPLRDFDGCALAEDLGGWCSPTAMIRKGGRRNNREERERGVGIEGQMHAAQIKS